MNVRSPQHAISPHLAAAASIRRYVETTAQSSSRESQRSAIIMVLRALSLALPFASLQVESFVVPPPSLSLSSASGSTWHQCVHVGSVRNPATGTTTAATGDPKHPGLLMELENTQLDRRYVGESLRILVISCMCVTCCCLSLQRMYVICAELCIAVLASLPSSDVHRPQARIVACTAAVLLVSCVFLWHKSVEVTG